MIVPLTLALALQATSAPPRDHWFGADKLKHFFVAAFTQTVTYSALQAAKVRHERASIAGAEPDMGCAVRTVLPQGAGADRLVAVVRHDHHCKAAACVPAGVHRADPGGLFERSNANVRLMRHDLLKHRRNRYPDAPSYEPAGTLTAAGR